MIVRPVGSRQNKASSRTIILLLSLYLCITAGFIFFYLRPTRAELNRMLQSSKTQVNTLSVLADLQKRHTAALAEYNETLRQANDLYSRFPKESDLPHILTVISNLTGSNAVGTEQINYSKPEWQDGVGKLKITALFSGGYRQLAKILVQLPQILPTARIEDVRFSSVLKGEDTTGKDISPEQGGLFADLPKSSITSAISSVLGVNLPFKADDLDERWNDHLSPLAIDHVEVHMVMTVWLMPETTGIAGGNHSLQKWYPRPPKPVDLPPNDPFQPSAKAYQLIEGRLIAEKLEQTKLTGIVATAGKTIANIQFNGQVYTVSEGDVLPDLGGAKIYKIHADEKKILLDIGGERITLKLGGN
jgi:Tfp pilus assembly protein PilO